MVGLLPGSLGSSRFRFMKILLRNKSTGFFYAGGNQWTDNVDAAHDFQTGLNALQHSTKNPSANVEFVYLESEVPDGFILPKLSTYHRDRL